MFRRHLLALAAMGLVPAAPADAQPAAVEVSGVRYEPTASVGGANLQLNGAGIRYKFVIKVYTLGMYLQAKAATPEAALAASGPKRLHVVMLREIDGNELGKLFTRGIQDNTTRDEFSRLIPGTIQMSEIFSTRRKLDKGDSFFADWVPGTGMVVSVNGKPVGQPIKEQEFYTALMKIWLGKSPADNTLKEALFGKAQAGS
jgi:Chalcone isomerase-like